MQPLHSTTTHTPSDRPAPLRLDHIDGLRALAALAVVVLHCFQMNGLGLDSVGLGDGTAGLTGGLGRAIYLLYENVVELFHYAVQVFIVLSGFSLMLPVVRRGDGTLSGGALRFFKRRARRILPPYYAALALALLIIALIPGMNSETGHYWDLALPALQPVPIVAHMLLIHNLVGDSLAINPPMWTIAVEWQIYFLFPLLVLIWRRVGTLLTSLIAIAYGMAMGPLHQASGLAYPFSYWWFVGLFALGMAAASLSYSQNPRERAIRDRLPWWWLAAGGVALFLGLKLLGLGHAVSSATLLYEKALLETILGVAVLCMLVALSRAPHERPRWSPGALASHPVLVRIGHFSYSLYLIHVPILAVLALVLRNLQLPAIVTYPVLIVFGTLLAVALSYLFHLAFERPFMSSDARKAASKPAPATAAVLAK